ncbi:Protein of unknown function (DUF3795) [Candidatus Methanophagaceae archaeon]|nr:Protein of unknown function (DUF3795) [Methanophagales archaeon]
MIVGACGLACDACAIFTKDECKGCPEVTGAAEPKCAIAECATKKGMKLCSECGDFVCSILEQGRPFSKSYVEMLKTKA